MNIPRVVIVGAGFGGVSVARGLAELARADKLKLTLINKTNYFLFTPLLHEVATGGLSPLSVVEPLREIFRGNDVEIVEGEATAIDIDKKIVSADGRTFAYDYLVLSTGAETAFHDVPGAKENSLTLKTLNDALSIRNAILSRIEAAAEETDREREKELLTFVVVGGGATGVELSAEIVEFAKVTLAAYYRPAELQTKDLQVILLAVEEEILQQFPPRLRRVARKTLEKKGVKVMTGQIATEIKEKGVVLKSGQTISSSLTVWTAGVKAVFPPGLFQKLPNGRLSVNECLQATDRPEVFILGDLAAQANPLPMLAQVAAQQGRSVACNIRRILSGKTPTPFRFRSKGLLISLGQWRAAGRIMGITFHGRFAWWLWRTVYLFNFHSPRKRFRIATEWTMNLFYRRDISKIR